MSLKPRILVIDDDEPILRLMSSILSEFNFDPFTAISGLEALSKAERVHPDLILLDMNMPGMSGREVIERFRGEGSPTVPILILSGEPVSAEELVEVRADGAIQKPFDLNDLLGKIRQHLPAQ